MKLKIFSLVSMLTLAQLAFAPAANAYDVMPSCDGAEERAIARGARDATARAEKAVAYLESGEDSKHYFRVWFDQSGDKANWGKVKTNFKKLARALDPDKKNKTLRIMCRHLEHVTANGTGGGGMIALYTLTGRNVNPRWHLLMHEASHALEFAGDHAGNLQELASKKPGVAAHNAGNYTQFAKQFDPE